MWSGWGKPEAQLPWAHPQPAHPGVQMLRWETMGHQRVCSYDTR